MLVIIALALIAGTQALELNTITGKTPPAPPCPACNGRPDGNYAIPNYPHDFLQCANGINYCQSCWPHNLEYSQSCDQCLYKASDDCYTTVSWKPHSTYTCPDLCPGKDPKPFSGNMADPTNPNHYIGCWKGVTQGCVVCPAGLHFNEPWNACLYKGLYNTVPEKK